MGFAHGGGTGKCPLYQSLTYRPPEATTGSEGSVMKKRAASKRKVGSRSRSPSERLPMPDRRAMEKMTSDLTRLLQSRQFSSEDELNAFLRGIQGASDIATPPPATSQERAQEIMYEAWEAHGKRRVELAHQALQESQDCADAYVLLAEETAKTAEAARDLYAQGVAAGERALGSEYFKENAGDFWGLIETRPYMRAREGLAGTLQAMGELPQAIVHYRELL